MAETYSSTVKILTDTSAAKKELNKFIADAKKQTIKINAQVQFNQSNMKSTIEKQFAGVTKGLKLQLPETNKSPFSGAMEDAKKVKGLYGDFKKIYADLKPDSAIKMDLFQVTNEGKLTTFFSALKSAQAAAKGTGAAVSGVGAAASTAATATTVLASALTTGAFIAAGAAIAVVTNAISNYIHRHEIAVTKASELTEAFQTQADTIKNNKSKINSVTGEFTKLARGVSASGENISLSADEFERYHDIVNEICGLSPTLVQGIDTEGNAIANKNTLLKEAIKLQEEEKKYNLSKMTSRESNITIGKGAVGELKLAEKESNKSRNAVVGDVKKTLNASFGTYSTTTYGASAYNSTSPALSMSKEKVQEFASAFNLNFDPTINSYLGETENYLDKLLSNTDNVQILMQSLTDNPGEFTNFLPEGADIETLKENLIEYSHSLMEVERASRAFNKQLLLNAQDSSSWESLSAESQSFVTGYVNNNKLTGDETEEDFKKIKVKMDAFVSAIKNSPTAQYQISDLIEFQANSDDIPVDQYIEEYEDWIDEIVNGLGLTDNAAVEMKLQLKASLDDTKKLQSDIESELKKKGFESQLNFTANLSASELQLYYEILSDPKSEFKSPADLQREFERQDYKIKATAKLEVDKSEVDNLITETNEVFGILSSASTGKSISIDDFNSEELKEYRSALEKTNGVMQLNAEKIREIAAARGEEKIATMEVAKRDLQNTYHQNFQAIAKLNDQLKNNKSLSNEEIESLNSKISKYQEVNAEIGSNIDQYKIMINSIREANSDYQAFLSSQGATNSGQMYSDANNAMGEIFKGLDSGKTGTQQFKTAVKFLMPEIDLTDTQKVKEQYERIKEQYEKLKRYIFEEDDDSKGAENFKEDLLTLDGFEIDKDGILKIADGINPEDIAKSLNIAPAVVQSLFGLLEDYGTEIDFGSGFFDDPMAELVNIERKITETQALIDEAEDGTIELDSTALDKANTKLEQLNDQKAALTSKNLDLYLSNEKEIADKQTKLDNAQKALDNYTGGDKAKELELQVNVEKAQNALNELEEKKEKLIQPTAMDITLAIDDIDTQIAANKKKLTGDEAQDEETNKEIKKLEVKRTEYLEIDTTSAKTEIDGVQGVVSFLTSAFQKSNKIKVDNTTALSSIRRFKKEYDSMRQNIIDNPIPFSFPIISFSNNGGGDDQGGSEGPHGVMGNALVRGMNNRTQRRIRQKYKSTLVGELGREIVVDPHTGNWYTVGDRGAEMVVLPRNALVFNHRQTEDLLGKHSISSRAKAVNGLSGLAFAKGNSKSENTQTIDWFEKSIDRLNKTISLLTAKLSNSSAIKTLVHYTKLLLTQQTKVLNTYSKSIEAYKKQFNKDLKPLSKEDQKKVKSGKYSIEEFNVDKEKEKKRYDALNQALDSKSKYDDAKISFQDAKAKLKEFAEELAEIPWNKAQEAIEKLSDKLSLLDAKLDNAIGYQNKNKIIDDKISLEQKKVSEQNKAVKESTKSVNESKNEIYKKFGSQYSKQTSKNQKISTKGLSGKDLEIILKYNANIDANRKNIQEAAKGAENFKKILSDSAKQKFDNIDDHYQKRKGNINSRDKKISNEISLAEAKGQQIGAAFYKEQERLEKQNKDYLLAKKAAQKKDFDEAVSSGKVKMYSDDWYKMRDAMYETDQQIQQSNLSLVELANKMRELEWKNFDKLMDQFSDLVSESDFLISLMSNRELINKDGSYTAEGLATQGQHAYNYDVYMAESENLLKQINALDPNSKDQAVIDRRNQLTKQRQDSIKAAEAEKKAIIDLKQKGIDAEISAMKELVDEKKKALDSEKELRDYQKAIAEKTKNIAKLQKQIKALEGDDSQENQKRLRELKAKLAEAQDDLSETTEKKAIDDTKDALDKALEEKTQEMDEYSKDIDKMFSDTLATVNKESDKIATTLTTAAENVGYTISNNITSAWRNAGDAVTIYSKHFMISSTGVLSVLEQMKIKWQEVTAAAEQAARASVNQSQNENHIGSDQNTTQARVYDILKNANGTGAGTSALNQFVKSYANTQLSYANMAELAKVLGISGVTAKNIVNDTKTKNLILEELKKHLSYTTPPKQTNGKMYGVEVIGGFSAGGIVEKSMAETVRSNGDSGFATLRAGETVLTDDFTRMLPYAVDGMKAFTDVISNQSLSQLGQLHGAELSRFKNSTSDTHAVSIDVNAPLIHCEKFDADFVRDLQKNTTYQNAILDLVWSPVTDGKTHRINRNR